MKTSTIRMWVGVAFAVGAAALAAFTVAVPVEAPPPEQAVDAVVQQQPVAARA